MYYHLRQAWKKPDMIVLRQRMIAWRAGDSITEVEKPLRLDRARALGYKAKKGFFVARVKILRGGRKRTRPKKGRRSKRMTNRKTLKMSYQWVAEIRAANRFPNLEVLNSYLIGKDGKHAFFEVIMVDPSRPEIANDKNLNWLLRGENRMRAHRGLTSAGKKSRGLRYKGPNRKVRPSGRAWDRMGK